jgi:hypothetical protein
MEAGNEKGVATTKQLGKQNTKVAMFIYLLHTANLVILVLFLVVVICDAIVAERRSRGIKVFLVLDGLVQSVGTLTQAPGAGGRMHGIFHGVAKRSTVVRRRARELCTNPPTSAVSISCRFD